MKRIGLLVLVLAAVLSTTAAGDDFFVIVGGGGAGTHITSASVPFTINSPGFYYLKENLIHNGSGNAITINADDVTLDLMGFSVIKGGSQGISSGIYMAGRSNVEIRNGTVQGFLNGIIETDSIKGKKHRVINVRVTNNTDGIFLNGVNHLIQNCDASHNDGDGLSIGTGVISDCVVCNNNGDGISINGPGSALGNLAANNPGGNFVFGNGSATAIMVDRNSAYGNAINYLIFPGTTGVVMGNNAGLPTP